MKMKMKLFVCLTLTVVGVALGNSPKNPSTKRVLFSEASSICNSYERFLVASVIKNRIKHSGFDLGKLTTMEEVVEQKNQFSCIGDKNNLNWNNSGKYLKTNAIGTADEKAWKHSVLLSNGTFTPYPEITAYHDKSISKPKGWDNKYWTYVKVLETKHFVFYKVVAN